MLLPSTPHVAVAVAATATAPAECARACPCVYPVGLSPSRRRQQQQKMSGTHQTCHYKLVLLGDTAVGKSCLVVRFVRDEFFEFQEPTIGAAFLTQRLVLDNTTVKFEIWDTAGALAVQSVCSHFKQADSQAAGEARRGEARRSSSGHGCAVVDTCFRRSRAWAHMCFVEARTRMLAQLHAAHLLPSA